MRREGHLTGHTWNKNLHEMVKAHRKPTNASKSSSRCGSRSLPLSKSMAKTKGCNKLRAFALRDECSVLRPLPCRCSKRADQTAKATLSDADYDDYDHHLDVWHSDDCIRDISDNSHAVAYMPSFYSEDEDFDVSSTAAAFAEIPNVWNENCGRNSDVYLDVVRAPSIIEDDCSTARLAEEIFSRLHASITNPVDEWLAILPDLRDGYGDHKAKDCLFQYNGVLATSACTLTHLKDVLKFEDEVPGHDAGASDWDRQLFATMASDIILVATGKNCNKAEEISGETAFTCQEDHRLSDAESDKTSLDEEWCHVQPSKAISDDWYLC